MFVLYVKVEPAFGLWSYQVTIREYAIIIRTSVAAHDRDRLANCMHGDSRNLAVKLAPQSNFNSFTTTENNMDSPQNQIPGDNLTSVHFIHYSLAPTNRSLCV